MMQIVTTEDPVLQDQTVIEWENVCWGRTEWDTANVLTKVVGSILLLYMYNYLVAKQAEWNGKPTFTMLTREINDYMPPTLPDRRWISAGWLGAGLAVNGFSLVWSGLVSIIIIYEAESAVDIVLNALALFFIVDIDNDIVSPDYKEFMEYTIKSLLQVRRDAFRYLREQGKYSNFLYFVGDDI